MEMNWFIVYTKPEVEKKVLNLLSQKNIEYYWPKYKDAYGPHDKNYHSHPLFKSYIFVKTYKNTLKDLKKIPGVLNMVYWLNRPAIISESEIKYLKEFLDDHVDVSIEKVAVNMQWLKNPANNITIENENIYKDSVEQKNLTLYSLGYKITARVRKGQVKIIPSWRSQKNAIPYKFSLTQWILGN